MNLDREKYLTPLRRPNNPPLVGGKVESARAGGGPAWRCVFIHSMTDAEEGDTHNVYVDLLDAEGKSITATDRIRIQYGWENMAADVGNLYAPCEKLAPEPLANVPIFRGAHVWVKVDFLGVPSDRAFGFNIDPDGHESFYAVFQAIDEDALPVAPRTVNVPVDMLFDVEAKLKGALTDVQIMRGGA